MSTLKVLPNPGSKASIADKFSVPASAAVALSKAEWAEPLIVILPNWTAPVAPIAVCSRERRFDTRARAWHFHGMSSITIPLPDEDLDFLRAYMRSQGSSAEAFLARQARNLRQHLQKPTHPDVSGASGIIAPEADGEQAYREHLEKKHA